MSAPLLPLRKSPRTSLAEVYYPPLPGFGVRGADIDKNGVVWTSLGSGHLGEFDRRKCEGPLNGPEATGNHCPEGWTLHDLPGPGFAELPQFSVESSYYTWVDQHNSLGLGEDVPIATGNQFDGVHALVDGEFLTYASPIRWASTRKASRAASMIPTPGGRVEDCGCRRVIAPPGSRKAVRYPNRSSYTSRFVRIRWRNSGAGKMASVRFLVWRAW